MADISRYLQAILDAVYGEEVRGSIHDALMAMNAESTSAMQYASTAKDSAQVSAASAADSANTAGIKADAAAVSASEAAVSEGQAKIAEQNASNHANDALNAASRAAASEQNASNSEASALAAKQAAENSESAAQIAKTDAEVARDSAEASALSARQYSGKPAKPDPVTKTWLIWNADTQQYEDSGIGSDIEGPQGVGIDDIKLTSGDHTPGSADIYTVYLTDGSTYNISVWNGRNGEGAGDVLGRSFELLIPASGWNDGRVTIADDRLFALSTHKYFIEADEASREEYLNCGVRALDISTNGFITFVNTTEPTDDLTVSVLRFELSAND